MKNLKKFLAVLFVAAMVTGFSGNVCRAKLSRMYMVI